jgi:hypothetical protein
MTDRDDTLLGTLEHLILLAVLALGTEASGMISITTLSTEAMSAPFIVAFLTIGPCAAVLGALLSRARGTAA